MFSNTRSKKTKYSDPRRKPRTSSHREPVTRTYRNLSSRKSKRVPQPSVRPNVAIVAQHVPVSYIPYWDLNQTRQEVHRLNREIYLKQREADIRKEQTRQKQLVAHPKPIPEMTVLDRVFTTLNPSVDYTKNCKGETDCPITGIPLSWLQENKRLITLDGTCYSMYIFATQPITANVFQYNPFRIGTVEDKLWTPPTQGIIDTYFKNDQIRSALKVEFDAISNLDFDNLPTIRQIYSNKQQTSKAGGRSSRRRTRRNHRKT